MRITNLADAMYAEQERRKHAGSFGYGDFGLRKNEDLYGMGAESDSDDITRGSAIIQQFLNSYLAQYGGNLTLNDLLAKYQTPGNGDLLSIGGAAYAAGMSDAQTQAAMDALVAVGGGKLPANWNGFVSALSGQATQINWIDAASFVATQSASEIAAGAQAVGTSVISAGGFFTSLLQNKVFLTLAVGAVAYHFMKKDKVRS